MPTQTSSALTGTLCQVTAVLHADRNSVQQLSLANIDPSCDKLLANATLTPQQANFALQSVYLGLTELLEQRYRQLTETGLPLTKDAFEAIVKPKETTGKSRKL